MRVVRLPESLSRVLGEGKPTLLIGASHARAVVLPVDEYERLVAVYDWHERMLKHCRVGGATMDALATLTAAPPVLFGAPAPPGELLPWSWAEQRLLAAQLLNRHHPPRRSSACRPMRGV